jgi:hypothetical protein
MDNNTSKTISRRGFISTSTVALTGLTIVSGSAASGSEPFGPIGKEFTAAMGGMMKTKSAELADSITDWWLRNDLFDPAGVFGNTAIFIESYAIRGGLARVRWLRAHGRLSAPASDHSKADVPPHADEKVEDAMVRKDARTSDEGELLLAGAFAFCDRVIENQGVQGPPEALMMGYGLKIRDGLVQNACVADQATIARAVLETIELRPQHPRATIWQAAIVRWADWVLASFARDNGGIGVGILSYKWNPIPEYWCATSLTTMVLFQLAQLTGDSRYENAGMKSLDWLARFDYTKVEIPTFKDCAPEVILYTMEGMVVGIQHLVDSKGIEVARNHPVAGQFAAMAQWLAEHQDANGRWPEPPDRGYRDYSCGIPWLLLRMNTLIGPNQTWKTCATLFLDGLATTSGERYYGLYVRPFTNGLAWLSAVTAAY